MARFFAHATAVGTFIIALDAEGRWALGFETEALDTHLTPEDAAEAVARGHCRWPTIGDPAALGVPADLQRWIAIDAHPAALPASRARTPFLQVVKEN